MLGRKLILLSLDWIRSKDPPLSLGHASILANLIKWDINVKSFEYTEETRKETREETREETRVIKDIETTLRSFGRGLSLTDIGNGAFIWNEASVQNITRFLKGMGFPGRIILGDPQISYSLPGIENEYPFADVFLRGYAEEAMLKLITSRCDEPIKGVHYREGPAWKSNCGFKETSVSLSHWFDKASAISELGGCCPFSYSFHQHREIGDHLKR